MAHSLCFTPLAILNSTSKPGNLIGNSTVFKINKTNERLPKLGTSRFQSLETKATEEKSEPSPTPKTTSILCSSCGGNGMRACTQCEGSGINSKDHFNGQFKAGQMCWLCRGKREILCGTCNGAGFTGGFMSTGEQ